MGSTEFANTPFAKWRKLLSELPSSKNEDDLKQFSHDMGSERGNYTNKRRPGGISRYNPIDFTVS